jgi:hypothetical protein
MSKGSKDFERLQKCSLFFWSAHYVSIGWLQGGWGFRKFFIEEIPCALADLAWVVRTLRKKKNKGL